MARPSCHALALVAALVPFGCASEPPPGAAEGPVGSARPVSSASPAPAPIEGCAPVALPREDPSDAYVVAWIEARRGCDGATWLVGETLERGARDVFVSVDATGCPAALVGAPLFAVLRVRATAGLSHPPVAACLAGDGGRELSTDRSQLGYALFRTEAAARAALAEDTR